MTTKAQSITEPTPCALCDAALTVLPNGFAYCRNFARDHKSASEWKTKSCLLAQYAIQLPPNVWQALNTRVSASVVPTVDDDLRNAFLQAAIEVHVGFQHPRPWADCDMAICNERKRLIHQPSTEADSADDTERDQAFREFWREQDRDRPFDYAHPERYAAFTKRYAPPAAASPVAPQQSAAGPKSNLEPHAYQEHPLYPNYCAFAVGDEDYCKRESDNAIHTTVPAPSAAIQDEAPTFRSTKEAMLYAQRRGIPSVIPAKSPYSEGVDDAARVVRVLNKVEQSNLSSLARKAATEIVPALATYECPWCRAHPHREPCCFQCASARDDKRLRAERVDQITAIIERCLSEGEALTLDEVQE